MALVYIALGSNIGDRGKNLIMAKEILFSKNSITLMKESSIDATVPVDYINQPEFLNQIVLAETNISPKNLLEELKKIEASMGRTGTAPKGPRIIDLDILLYDGTILNTTELIIPHPEIKRRGFILKLLLEIAPDLADPHDGKKYWEVFEECRGQSKI